MHHSDNLQSLLQMSEITKKEGWTMLRLLLKVVGLQEAAAETLVHGLEFWLSKCGKTRLPELLSWHHLSALI